MTRQAVTDSRKDQSADDRSAPVCGDQKAQSRGASIYLIYINWAHHAAKDRIQKICQHDHDDDGEDQLIVSDEAQSVTQFVKVRPRFTFLLDRFLSRDDNPR